MAKRLKFDESGDSDDLQALFDSIVGSAGSVSEPEEPPAQGDSDELQALCFLAGANSMFYGDHLLTTGNPDVDRDDALFARLGVKAV